MKRGIDTMPRLPDPRRYGPGDSANALVRLAANAESEVMLVDMLRGLLVQHHDGEVQHALLLAPSRDVYGRLWRCLCAATERSAFEVQTQVFALPLVLVSGARNAASMPGALPDVNALIELLQRHGAFGSSRNVGFGNALVSLDTLERLPPSTLVAWATSEIPAGSSYELAPAPVSIRVGEEVHLRFLLGAAIAPAAAPSVSETAAHIGGWGIPFARALEARLAVPGVELLALPRPPAGVLRACYSGRRAQLDVALNLFMSNAIRRCRAASGDPAVVISVHHAEPGGAELRVSISSLVDETVLEGYRWPLHPLDDPNEIAQSVHDLATECRLTDIRIVETVLPEGGGGVPSFVRADVAPPLRH